MDGEETAPPSIRGFPEFPRAVESAARPVDAAGNRRIGGPKIDRVRQALVEHHGDIDAIPRLGFNHVLRSQAMRRSIEMRVKGHAVVVQSATGGE